MINRHTLDLVAVILAFGAAATLIITALGAAWHLGPLSESESSLLSTGLGATIGAIATYLGIGRRGDPPTTGDAESPDQVKGGR